MNILLPCNPKWHSWAFIPEKENLCPDKNTYVNVPSIGICNMKVSVNEWLNKLCCTCTMEYYSVTKRNKLMKYMHNLGGPHDNYAEGKNLQTRDYVQNLYNIIKIKL